MTGQQAIERSISHNEIVTLITYTREEYDALCAELRVKSDDHADRGYDDVTEYWGTSDGDDWRVHVRLTA